MKPRLLLETIEGPISDIHKVWVRLNPDTGLARVQINSRTQYHHPITEPIDAATAQALRREFIKLRTAARAVEGV